MSQNKNDPADMNITDSILFIILPLYQNSFLSISHIHILFFSDWPDIRFLLISNSL